MNQNYTNDTMTWDENHAWVTEKTEESKCIMETLLFLNTQTKCT